MIQLTGSEQIMQREKKKSMTWVLFALSAALAWGFYGAMLHRGQVGLGNPMKALLCVGVAYFLIGVLAPVSTLASQGALGNFSKDGATWAERQLTALWRKEAGGE